MKNFISSILLVFALNAFGQTYVSSFSYTFNAGNNGTFVPSNESCNSDIAKTINTTSGTMDLVVNKTCDSLSALKHVSSSLLILKESTIEIRIKSTEAHDSLQIKLIPASGDTSIPAFIFSIDKADTWEIKVLKFNIRDTVSGNFHLLFPDGNYSIDYILLGDAAKAPGVIIDNISSRLFKDNASETIPVYASIPFRPTQDGLSLSFKTSGDTLLINPTLVKTPDKISPYEFSYSIDSIAGADTITITATDTIRGTSKSISFGIYFWHSATTNDKINITVYPTITNSFTQIIFASPFSGQIDLCDMQGKIIYTSNVLHSTQETIDLTSLSSAVYFIRINNGEEFKLIKVFKE